MSEAMLKKAIENKKIPCPECKAPIQKYEKYIEMTASVWDGAGDSKHETEGGKATLICGKCEWEERTEYWEDMIEE